MFPTIGPELLIWGKERDNLYVYVIEHINIFGQNVKMF